MNLALIIEDRRPRRPPPTPTNSPSSASYSAVATISTQFGGRIQSPERQVTSLPAATTITTLTRLQASVNESSCRSPTQLSSTNHLRGSDPGARTSELAARDFVVGVYPLLEDETCYFLAADVNRNELIVNDVADAVKAGRSRLSSRNAPNTSIF